MQPPPDPLNPRHQDFDAMVESWLSLTYVLNNLSRGLGLPDSYPFVLSAPVIGKLRFIHDTINEHRAEGLRVIYTGSSSPEILKCRSTSRSIMSCITAMNGT